MHNVNDAFCRAALIRPDLASDRKFTIHRYFQNLKSSDSPANCAYHPVSLEIHCLFDSLKPRLAPVKYFTEITAILNNVIPQQLTLTAHSTTVRDIYQSAQQMTLYY